MSLGNADAIERQRASCLALCRAREWTAVVEYVDDGASASKDRGKGTAFARMLSDAAAGRFDVVVAFAADRIARRLSDVERLVATGVKAATVQGGLDLTTPEGEAQAAILATFARMEVRQKAERQKAANAQRRAEGLPNTGGHRALGWERDGATLVQHEAEAVRDAARALLAGTSLRSIARDWNDRGLLTARGRPWAPYSVRPVLLNPRVAGFVARHVGRDEWEIDGQGKWPALLAEDTWRAVGVVLRDPGRRTTPGTARVHLLSGLALCALCGEPVMTGGTTGKVQTYRCSAGGGAGHGWSRAQAPVDGYVTSVVTGRLARPDAADLLHVDTRAGRADAQQRVVELRTRLGALGGLVADGTLSDAQVRTAALDLRTRLTAAEAELADYGRGDALAGLAGVPDAASRWSGVDLDRRRIIIDTLCVVRVLPAGRGARTFDPETVLTDWK